MDETETTETEVKKKSKMPLIIGLVLAVAGGGGGFFAVQSGMILGTGVPTETSVHEKPKSMSAMPDVAFVAIDPVIIPVQSQRGIRHLKFAANLEVPKSEQANVEALLPRAVDIFNGYLRAVELKDLENPTSLIMIRSHLLHRAKLVLGEERVNNLLIMEFVLS